MKPPLRAKSKSRQPATAPGLDTVAPQNHNTAAFVPSADDVAQRAYLNFQNQGAADGNDVNDWLRAESELVAEHQLSTTL